MEANDLTRRAFAAYFRSGGTDQPKGTTDATAVVDGRLYVRLSNANGTLAVYRVRTSGALKLLRRWPRELDQ